MLSKSLPGVEGFFRRGGAIMNRTIITVVGKDIVGIIAKVCTYLAASHINILDISQTIVDGYFNMMMVADVTDCGKGFAALADELRAVGEQKGGIDNQVAGIIIAVLPVQARFFLNIFAESGAEAGAVIDTREIVVAKVQVVELGQVLADDDIDVGV